MIYELLNPNNAAASKAAAFQRESLPAKFTQQRYLQLRQPPPRV
jgi:hypothetical protein